MATLKNIIKKMDVSGKSVLSTLAGGLTLVKDRPNNTYIGEKLCVCF